MRHHDRVMFDENDMLQSVKEWVLDTDGTFWTAFFFWKDSFNFVVSCRVVCMCVCVGGSYVFVRVGLLCV
jgi:hypothetical protein